MSLEKNKAIIRSLYEAANKQNIASLVKFITPDYVDHDLQLRGPEDVKQFETMFFKGFPDLHVTIKDITAEGDKVWVRIKYEGTHKGELGGIPPTNKKVTI